MLYLCKKILFLYVVREYELESMFLLETVDNKWTEASQRGKPLGLKTLASYRTIARTNVKRQPRRTTRPKDTSLSATSRHFFWFSILLFATSSSSL